MTINLLTWVPEGMVMCADSMVTLVGWSPEFQPLQTTFEHAEKVIELGSGATAAAMINGAGDIGGELFSGMLLTASKKIDSGEYERTAAGIDSAVVDAVNAGFARQIPRVKQQAADAYNTPDNLASINAERASKGLGPVKEIRAADIGVRNVPDQSPPNPIVEIDIPAVTIVVASYIEDPHAITIDWPGASVTEIIPARPHGVTWWGSGSSAVGRIVLGFDLSRLVLHADSDAEAAKVLDFAQRNRVAYAMPTPIQSMPLQDAVFFTEYLGQAACGYDRFSSGQAAVGGELDVLLLTPTGRVWIRRKTLHSSIPRLPWN